EPVKYFLAFSITSGISARSMCLRCPTLCYGISFRHLGHVQIEPGAGQQRCQRENLVAVAGDLRVLIQAWLFLDNLSPPIKMVEEFLRGMHIHRRGFPLLREGLG